MKNISKQKKQENQGSKKVATYSNDQQDSSKGNAEECIGESGDLGIEDESELELTLGPSCYNRRRKVADTSDSAPSFSSSSSDSSHVRRTNSGKPESNPGFLGEIKSNSNAPAEQFRQDKMKNPPWLFQFLSLNMT